MEKIRVLALLPVIGSLALGCGGRSGLRSLGDGSGTQDGQGDRADTGDGSGDRADATLPPDGPREPGGDGGFDLGRDPGFDFRDGPADLPRMDLPLADRRVDGILPPPPDAGMVDVIGADAAPPPDYYRFDLPPRPDAPPDVTPPPEPAPEPGAEPGAEPVDGPTSDLPSTDAGMPDLPLPDAASDVASDAGTDTPRFDGPPADFYPPHSVMTGGSCAFSDDCAYTTMPGAPGMPICLPQSIGFAGGYCTNFNCDIMAQNCPGWAQCFPGMNENVCLANCDPSIPSDCRPGYLCIDVGPPRSPVCYPGCINDAGCPTGNVCDIPSGQPFGTCSNPSKVIGDSCESFGDCPAASMCLSEADFGYPYGYCAGPECSPFMPGSCPAGSACFNGDGFNPGRCYKQCNSSSDCRTGYECRPDVFSREQVCVPRCLMNSHCKNMSCHIGTGLC